MKPDAVKKYLPFFIWLNDSFTASGNAKKSTDAHLENLKHIQQLIISVVDAVYYTGWHRQHIPNDAEHISSF